MSHWLWFYGGVASGNYAWYLFWSGIFADLTIFAAVLIGAAHSVSSYRKHNCHQHGCPRIGRFPVAAGQFVTCRRHHPDTVVQRGVRARHILAAHRAHLERTKGGTP